VDEEKWNRNYEAIKSTTQKGGLKVGPRGFGRLAEKNIQAEKHNRFENMEYLSVSHWGGSAWPAKEEEGDI